MWLKLFKININKKRIKRPLIEPIKMPKNLFNNEFCEKKEKTKKTFIIKTFKNTETRYMNIMLISL